MKTPTFTRLSKTALLALLNTTPMHLGIPLVCNPHKQQIISVLRHLVGILSALDLLYGSINGLVVFQFDKNGVN